MHFWYKSCKILENFGRFFKIKNHSCIAPLTNLGKCRSFRGTRQRRILYSISDLKNKNTSTIKLDSSDKPLKIINVPTVFTKENIKNYTFVINTFLRNNTYTSLISLTLMQCVDYWEECDINGACK